MVRELSPTAIVFVPGRKTHRLKSEVRSQRKVNNTNALRRIRNKHQKQLKNLTSEMNTLQSSVTFKVSQLTKLINKRSGDLIQISNKNYNLVKERDDRTFSTLSNTHALAKAIQTQLPKLSAETFSSIIKAASATKKPQSSENISSSQPTTSGLPPCGNYSPVPINIDMKWVCYHCGSERDHHAKLYVSGKFYYQCQSGNRFSPLQESSRKKFCTNCCRSHPVRKPWAAIGSPSQAGPVVIPKDHILKCATFKEYAYGQCSCGFQQHQHPVYVSTVPPKPTEPCDVSDGRTFGKCTNCGFDVSLHSTEALMAGFQNKNRKR